MREGFTDCGARGGHAACRVYGSRRHYSPLLHSPHTVGKVKNKPLDSWHQRELFSCFFLQDNMTHDIEEPFLHTLSPLCHLYCQKMGIFYDAKIEISDLFLKSLIHSFFYCVYYSKC